MQTLLSITVLTVLASIAFGSRVGSNADSAATNIKTANHNKRDLSLSYAATNIDSKEGTRVKTITVIKNHNNNLNHNGQFTNGRNNNNNNTGNNNTLRKLIINPELHKNEEWAQAFRDNFDSYGTIPDVPDIDDLFEFVNKKATKATKAKELDNKDIMDAPKRTKTMVGGDMDSGSGRMAGKPMTKPTVRVPPPRPMEPLKPMSSNDSGDKKNNNNNNNNNKHDSHNNEDDNDADEEAEEEEGPVEKIKGDAELIPSTSKRHSTIRSQSLAGYNNNNSNSNSVQRSRYSLEQLKSSGGASRTSSPTPPPPQFHYLRQQQYHHQQQQHNQKPQQSQKFEKYVVDISTKTEGLSKFGGVGDDITGGYAYPKPCQHPNYPNSISVTTPSGRTYDIPVPAVNANANGRPYIAPSIQKRTQPTDNSNGNVQFNNNRTSISVNSLLPPLPTAPGDGNFVLPSSSSVSTTPPQPPTPPSSTTTSQRPYVAPSLRGNGLGINRGPPPQSKSQSQLPALPLYPNYRNSGGVAVVVNNYRPNGFGLGGGGGLGGVLAYNRPNVARSRGLKY